MGGHLGNQTALVYAICSCFVLIGNLSGAAADSATRCNVRQVGPIPSMLPKQQVHAFAEAVAVELGYNPGEPLDILLNRIGGRLAYRDLFDATMNADSIKVDPVGTFTIFVSGLTSDVRDRFTIAHELGHYFLHFPLVRRAHPDAMMIATRWVDETNGDLRRAEWEANWFAAAFLMPSQPFKDALTACNNDLREVATLFGVSLHAAEIRRNTI